MIVGVVAVAVPAAEAWRPATESERHALKKLGKKDCKKKALPGYPCDYRGTYVSTADTRFAWIDVYGDAYSGALAKRSHGDQFRVVGWRGGGAVPCSAWRRVAPDKVVEDLSHGPTRKGGLPLC